MGPDPASFVHESTLVRARIVIALSLALLLVTNLAHAGILDSLRSETSGSSSSDDDDDGGGGFSFDWSSDDDDDDDYEPACSDLPEGCTPIPITTRRYTPYPYADGAAGRIHIIEEDDLDPAGHRFAGTATLDGAYYGPTLWRSGLAATLMFRRVGLGLDFAPHLETRPLDALMLGSANVLFAPVLRPRAQLHLGLGLNAMIDGRALPSGERTDALGFDVTTRLTVLPVRPLVLRARFDFGSLGAANALLFRTTAGLMIRRAELFAGFETRRVGRVQMLGPTTGVRVWF